MKIISKAGILILTVVFALTVQAEDKNVQAPVKTSVKPVNSAIVPTPKIENDFYDWYQRHQQVKEQIKKQPVDLVFIGDSITHMFGGLPHSNVVHGGAVWDKYYGGLNVVNMGFGWDRTQNVLWRLENGEFEGIQPKVAVLLIGTNNLTGTENARENTPSEIAEGIEAICETIRAKAPNCRILLLGILPRSPEKFVRPIREINRMISHLDKKDYITFMNFGSKIADKHGLPKKDYMYGDGVHPNEKGYQVWAESINSTLKKLLSEK
ncbi:MAG: GDSL-type esterase/lipase family protein [Candidatus Latescibacterota bacterium]